MNVGIICACMPAMPPFFRTHKLGLGGWGSTFRYRLCGCCSLFSSSVGAAMGRAGMGEKGKSFRGISRLEMTKPELDFKAEEYVELGEVSEGQSSARARHEYV